MKTYVIRLFSEPRRWWNQIGMQCKWKSNATRFQTRDEAEQEAARLRKNYPGAVVQSIQETRRNTSSSTTSRSQPKKKSKLRTKPKQELS